MALAALSCRTLRRVRPQRLRLPSTPMSTVATPTSSAPVAEEPVVAVKEEAPSTPRFQTTLEVIVSKIFPAGFGWQAASLVAGSAGMEADTASFALTTGAGDFAGVLIGHGGYSILKSAMGKSDDLKGDLVAGLWLATAAFCSGTAWQPTVNFLHDAAGCNFAQTVVGCGAVTGFCFFGGLRIGRILFAPLGLPQSNYANLCDDALLSVSIGAATGTFVGTDVTFADNVIRPFFGVEDSMTDVQGMVRAGMSTSTGFLFMQSMQNVTLPKHANWLDPVKL